MLFPALGMTTAMWLLMGPLMGIETGGRAALTVVVGALVLGLAPLGVRFRSASWAVAALGGLLGLVNLLTSAPIASAAGLATCAVALVAAGAGPQPTVLPASAASVSPIGTPAPSPSSQDRDDLIAA